MTIYFTYQLPNGDYQTLAAVDSVANALHLCEGYNNWKLFASLENIPALLRGIREYKGMTQEAVAAMLGKGYDKSTISNMESGRRKIGFEVLKSFGKAYGIDFGVSAESKPQ